MTGPYRGGQVHVRADLCSTCIFRPGNLMRLAPGRVKQMADAARADESAITCHQTLDHYPGTAQPAVCRGYWDGPGRDTTVVRLAIAMDLVVNDP